MGTTLGAMKRWANKFSMPIEAYVELVEYGFKRCKACNIWKPAVSYPSDKSRKDGLNTSCHDCIRTDNPQKPILPEWAKEILRRRNKTNKWAAGNIHTKETRAILRKIIIESGRFVGEKNPNWKGGITPENHKQRTSDQYKQWRSQVFKRDGYACQKCGDDSGGNLQAHHCKSWHANTSLRFDVDNGTTLCKACHILEHLP